MERETICVCGAGTMGSGIAQVTAAAGFATLLYDLNEAALQQATARLHGDLKKLVARQKLTEEKAAAILENIVFTSDPLQCKASIIIEAIVEKMPVKAALFNQLAAQNNAETIFATNTSSLSVSELAAQINGPERVAGLHFFNPAPVMKLVEVVRGHQTGDAVLQRLVAFAKNCNKVPVVCRDAPGFIVNRVARPYYIEALRLVEEEQVSIEKADELLQAVGFKLGPFGLMDLIGNDVNYAVSCSIYEQLKKPERLKPSPLQEEKVASGALGKKAGRGYYTY
ncbi:MAG TPA: 3-hydroxyacyl-CoA dehydrogenase NAD-binding domain-containing protein [Chitinophagaceae bacterium]|nr:3-hydroxyacyl-CoA dehydrogenase NAD-binding domain-containing protein [Chitinophagaceae bacterium]